MSDATCKTCPYCDLNLTGTYGECRRRAPGLIVGEGDISAVFPMVSDIDWCGEHPDRQPRLECATTTLVGRETFPTAADMCRIVDALEKMATNAAKGCAR